MVKGPNLGRRGVASGRPRDGRYSTYYEPACLPLWGSAQRSSHDIRPQASEDVIVCLGIVLAICRSSAVWSGVVGSE